MQILVRYFSEITLKSRPVRKQLCRKLANNLRRQLASFSSAVQVDPQWDHLFINLASADPSTVDAIFDCLRRTPGIAWFAEVRAFPFESIDQLVRTAVPLCVDRVRARRFAVRSRRIGEHPFRSQDVDRALGAALLEAAAGSRVDLSHPEEEIRLEIRRDRLLLPAARQQGIGGYPAGSLGSVVSLVSGGFDSMVATWMTMRRGLATHMCLFRLGGLEHEQAVEELALYLWLRYGGGAVAKFVSVPFEDVVADIAGKVDPALGTIVLKRQMLRAATLVARRLRAKALVTGESLAQVSSQTLDNLTLIDRATEAMVLRPLAMESKVDIVRRARELGIEEMVQVIPEYCGAVSSGAAASAHYSRILEAEARLDGDLLTAAVSSARSEKFSRLAGREASEQADTPVAQATADDIVIDIRHPAEIERKPLRLTDREVVEIPFYSLASRFSDLDATRRYLLYCEQGVMSRVQAGHLRDLGFANVAALEA